MRRTLISIPSVGLGGLPEDSYVVPFGVVYDSIYKEESQKQQTNT